MRLLGASAALAGVGAGGCSRITPEKIMPYADRPPELTPGVPRAYATTMALDGFGVGLVVRSNEGRPTKVEGNPEHPASLGATGVFEQASVLELYDPDRVRVVQRDGMPSSWRSFLLRGAGRDVGPEPRFLLYTHSSPLVAALIERVRQRFPGARFTFESPIDRRPVYEAAQRALGRPLETQYDFRRADVVLSLDADFTSGMPMSIRWARDFAARRRLASADGPMSRLYVAETMPSPTGTLADHRLRVRAAEVREVAIALLAALSELGAAPEVPGALAGALRDRPATAHQDWVGAVARDLAAHRGRSVVIAGDRQPVEVHLLVHAINAALGNHGEVVTFTEPALASPEGGDQSVAQLAAELRANEVATLVIAEANPVYTSPADLDLARSLVNVPNSIHLTLHANETSAACRWVLPAAHYLESWGDARAYDGTTSLVQPLVEPFYGGRTVAEVLAGFAGLPDTSGYTLLREMWRERLPDADFERQWAEALRRGLFSDSAAPAVEASLDWQAIGPELARPARRGATGLELNLVPSPAVYDGRFANNGWLQELPQPLTKLTWDNAAILSPRTAADLEVDTGRVVELHLHGQSLRAPVLVLPGHADGAVTLALGYGRRGAERIAARVGANAYTLRTTRAPWFSDGLELRVARVTHALAVTQQHQRLHGREIALHRDLEQYRRDPAFTAEHRGPLPSLLPDLQPTTHQWGMAIDTMICTGCSACVVACQAENNVPIVGKADVRKSREMHWLRIDQYLTGAPEEPEVVNQPMLCQHCEKAPCEYVCPVYATTHSPDGLNEMTYNRCIGTRFCSNNCPYKVRRFNWFLYTDDPAPLSLQRNPNVTVRERGVMEKCTFCVQRIRGAEIQARLERRELSPGEVVTACQQACPTGAIQFGLLDHEDTDTVRWRRQDRAYGALHELGTRPRIAYLAMIRNRNPEIG